MAQDVIDLSLDSEDEPRPTPARPGVAPAARSSNGTATHTGHVRKHRQDRNDLEQIAGTSKPSAQHQRRHHVKMGSSASRPTKSAPSHEDRRQVTSRALQNFISGAKQDPIMVGSDDEDLRPQPTQVAPPTKRKRQFEHEQSFRPPSAKKQRTQSKTGHASRSPSLQRFDSGTTVHSSPRKLKSIKISVIDLTEEGAVEDPARKQGRHVDISSASRTLASTHASDRATPGSTSVSAATFPKSPKRSLDENASSVMRSSKSLQRGVARRLETSNKSAIGTNPRIESNGCVQSEPDRETSEDTSKASGPEIPESPPPRHPENSRRITTSGQRSEAIGHRDRKNGLASPLSRASPLPDVSRNTSRSSPPRKSDLTRKLSRTTSPKAFSRNFPLSPSETSTEDQTVSGRAANPTAIEKAAERLARSKASDSFSSHLAGQSTSTAVKKLGQSTHDGQIIRPTDGGSQDAQNGLNLDLPFGTTNHIREVVRSCLDDAKNDNVYWLQSWLREARHSADTRRLPAQEPNKPTSVFKNMKPLELSKPEKKNRKAGDATITYEIHKATVKPSRKVTVPVSTYSTDAKDVPQYSHHVSIKRNLLASNEKTLAHWPYFGDDFDMKEALGLHQQYSIDIKERERKLFCMLKAEHLAEYAEDMLSKIKCQWSDVLQFMLASEPNVGPGLAAHKALERRDGEAGAFLDEDLDRDSQRWYDVLAKLPDPDPARTGRVALLCEQFRKSTNLSFWHIARRSTYMKALLLEQPEELDSDDLTCRVCMRFNCPYHGEVDEVTSLDGKSEHETVKTDIINPPNVNYRSRTGFLSTIDEEDIEEADTLVPKSRRSFQYWQRGNNANLRFKPDERGPFYPCHHPGSTCESAQCSCYENKTPCEKSCTCPRACTRKFQGCNCPKTRRKDQPACFESEQCACFQLGRECDPDLCGDCGVCDVLDPAHQHEQLGSHCRNASIQRGVPKHTLLGDSQVHGLGLYACEDIFKDEYVGEYRGEIITREEAERRGAVYEHQRLSYLFSLNKHQEIDSTYFGNKVRFINHADKRKANLYPRIIMVNTVYRIALYGSRTIKAGEELFFDYGPDFPQEQLGGSGDKGKLARKTTLQQSKAAPRVRNNKIVAETFHDVVHDRDELGNVRARKTGKLLRPGRGRPKKLPRSGGPGRPRKLQRETVEDVEEVEDTAKVDDEAAEGVAEAEYEDEGDTGEQGYAYDLFRYNIAGDDADLGGPVDEAAADDDEEFEPEDESTSEAGDDGADAGALMVEAAEEMYGRPRGRPKRYGN